ncbi:MAG: protein translocase subunit SecF [Candidatus Hydrothermarchaeaceae archaeon]
MATLDALDNILTLDTLKKLMIIPVLMVLASIVIIGVSYNAGTIPLSIDFKGGTVITVYDVPEGADIKTALEGKFGVDVQESTIKDFSGKAIGKNFEIEKFFKGDEATAVKDHIISQGISEENISVRDISPSITGLFIEQSIKAVLFAFLFMAGVVFWRFRTVVPSLAVILSAFSDIVTTLAIMIVLQIQLSLGSFVALLLLIGYSVDTDILLTTRLLVKRQKDIKERIKDAMRTGLTMAGTTISAMAVLLLVATSGLLKEIAVVLLIGLLVDLINTWIQNVGILWWHLEGGKGKKVRVK